MKELSGLIEALCEEMGIDQGDARRRMDFLEFDARDRECLRIAHERLASFRGQFLDELYDRFRRFPATSALLPDESGVEHLKRTQARYFDTLTAGDYGWEYILDRLRVGAAHQRAGLDTKWYLGAYSSYLIAVLQYLHGRADTGAEEYERISAALIKIILLDIGLAMDAYLYAAKRRESAARAYAQSIIDNAPCGMLIVDESLTVRSSNVAARRILCLQGNGVGQTVYEWLPPERLQELVAHSATTGQSRCLISFPGKTGEMQYLLTSLVHLPHRDSVIVGEPPAPLLLLTFEDISSLMHARRDIRRMSYYDHLTGLPNRKKFVQILDAAIQEDTAGTARMAVLFLDLNRFKNINDSLGHEAGDALLQTVASRLAKALRNQDIIAHFGGDHFTILLREIAGRDDCMQVISKINRVLARSCRIGEREIFPSANIGVSMYPDDSRESSTLLRYADAALHHSKSEGQGKFCVFYPGMETRAARTLDLEAGLRQALEREQFFLHYQPIIDTDQGRVLSFEALLRWRRPDQTVVPPTYFIPILEDTGLIIDIGEWVLQEACRTAMRWKHDISISVNVSSIQLAVPDFGRRVMDILTEIGIPPQRLEIELTENLLIEEAGAAAENIGFLAGQGVRLAIDDFGIGYSSLGYLNRFPLSTLKVDRSFVIDICSDSRGAALARTIITLGRMMELRVVAEGVENGAQMQLLRDWGCTAMQGFLFSRPVDDRESEEIARRDWRAAQAGLPGMSADRPC